MFVCYPTDWRQLSCWDAFLLQGLELKVKRPFWSQPTVVVWSGIQMIWQHTTCKPNLPWFTDWRRRSKWNPPTHTYKRYIHIIHIHTNHQPNPLTICILTFQMMTCNDDWLGTLVFLQWRSNACSMTLILSNRTISWMDGSRWQSR
jgi:hypothetical protein